MKTEKIKSDNETEKAEPIDKDDEDNFKDFGKYPPRLPRRRA